MSLLEKARAALEKSRQVPHQLAKEAVFIVQEGRHYAVRLCSVTTKEGEPVPDMTVTLHCCASREMAERYRDTVIDVLGFLLVTAFQAGRREVLESANAEPT